MNARRETAARNSILDEIVQTAVGAASKNLPTAPELVAKVANQPAARNLLFTRLKEIGKENIFPEIYRSIEKVAESDLAR